MDKKSFSKNYDKSDEIYTRYKLLPYSIKGNIIKSITEKFAYHKNSFWNRLKKEKLSIEEINFINQKIKELTST
ncbi:hypothetical protein HNQ88_003009 [Aureibacter tunicatorum]|uniref:Uncharacterized protein n=1 Tax=Aureibacter tunicatorum TaxID=866807 RepID=A0AAE3XL91_9BACT|nr:hypothetical protein [Aureibacter tunicatorum]BDD04434.1 hypothetical protein AUTU_19170 [Aureibacter tunicatorum]